MVAVLNLVAAIELGCFLVAELCGLGSGLDGFGSGRGTKRAAVVGGHGYGVHNRRRWVIVLTDC
ncbi:hypothetical protein LINGRAHAP2_LOCUS20310 [Linum grandiflorum]